MKCIENCTKDELCNLLEDIPRDTVLLVYDFLHKKSYYTVHQFANYKYISTSTLYRKVNLVKREYERRS